MVMATPESDTRLSYRGAARVRGDGTEPTQTADQRLLRSADIGKDPWRVLRIRSEFVEGVDTLSQISSAVTVFGSAWVARDAPFYDLGRDLGAALAAAGHPVITGGGPGLFEALTPVQDRKVTQFPIMLLGKDFWEQLLDWVRVNLSEHAVVSAADVAPLQVTDSVDGAVAIVQESRQRQMPVERQRQTR